MSEVNVEVPPRTEVAAVAADEADILVGWNIIIVIFLHPHPPPHHHPFSTLVKVPLSSSNLAKTFVRTKTNRQTAALHKIGKAASGGLHNSHVFIAIQHVCPVPNVKRE